MTERDAWESLRESQRMPFRTSAELRARWEKLQAGVRWLLEHGEFEPEMVTP